MKTLLQNAVLLLIDVQQGFDDPYWGVRNNRAAEGNIARLLDAWRRSGRSVVHIRHDSVEPGSPLRPGQPGNQFKPEALPLPQEHIEAKSVNSGFIGTGLENHLRSIGCQAVVIVGLTTDHCVSTTTRMAGNLGFETFVVADATATFNRRGFDGRDFAAQDVHECALASLHREFAEVVTTDELIEAVTSCAAAS
jgi:nicotinamidase-related amidase